MDNPFKTAREELRLSHKDVAEKTGLTKLFIIRQEQGVYPNPSDRLIEFYRTDEFNRELYRMEYKKFQTRCRLHNGPTEKPVLYPVSPFAIRWAYNTSNELIHPMKMWMNWNGKELSGMEVCKAYCYSPPSLQRFLADTHRVKTMPPNLIDVLLEAGYTTKLVFTVDELYREWRKHGN